MTVSISNSENSPQKSASAVAMPVKKLSSLTQWLDTGKTNTLATKKNSDHIDWLRASPFIVMHLAPIAIVWVGVSSAAVWCAIALYLLRMFAITGFYHRYFSHKNFATGRIVQFIFAFIGASAAQRGPLWWAAHHRHHHRVSDSEKDPHSPKHKGFLNSHCLWFLTDANFATRHERVKDLMKYPELVWLDRFDWIAPVTLAFAVYGFGAYLESNYPALNTSAGQVFIWGFVVSTIVLYHATYTINSLAHAFGSRRFATKDDSRNNWLLALLTLGEGWHNNHHYYCGTVRQGFKWWEIDITFYLLKIMSWMGLVKNLKPIPAKVKQAMALQKGN